MSPPKNLTTFVRVRELLSYDWTTGEFTWSVARSGHRAGAVAGSSGQDGYRTIMIDGKAYKAHRLAWLLYYGSWPVDQIDHINRVRNDNRIKNLRQATKSENQINSGIYRNNKSGYRGAHWRKATNKWVTTIRGSGKTRHLGVFTTAAEAHESYLRAAQDGHTR